MKVQLMHADRDFDSGADLPPNERDLRRDLELDRLLEVMAGGDEFLHAVCERALLNGSADPQEIRYRQDALRDCLAHIDVVIGMYDIVFEVLTEERKHWLFSTAMYQPPPDRLIDRSITLLGAFLGALVRVRDLAAAHRAEFASAAFTQLFETLSRELDDSYVATVRDYLGQLRFPKGAHFSVRIEKGGGSTDYVLRRPRRGGLLSQLGQLTSLDANSHTFHIPDRDMAGLDAAAELYGRGITEVAESLNRSCDHVTAFLRQLRTELGFYIGCQRLHRELRRRENPVCFPDPVPTGEHTLTCRGLYDPCLALANTNPVVGNDIDADGIALIVVTGANQGGKSTFLRSTGLAQLMMQAGMFTAATQLRMNTRSGVFTHFKREEDETMIHGKFDEELVRMNWIVDHLPADGMLLCNESFAATNEREGSAIARDIVRALTAAGVEICYVTHMYDLASSLYHSHEDPRLFLRAERRDDGSRSFHVIPAPPLPTSYGNDVYRKVFGTDAEAQRSLHRSSR